ncbi:hypothetical protein CC86DRAFT_363291 [Ophiobolus disseminans]|uniref:Uncharacterized protein n=1 Tax=Ophiobolus disseminans TaxID=1469910 RepID=A0A6A6ZG41_9PLEO|nr:hypothetical protein CC86DRAFT_363291 [Ophiobolus disseminans]
MQLPAVRQLGSSESQHSATPLARRYSDYPRAPRQQYPHNSYNNYRSDGGGREELARMNALLMKTRNELEVERRKNANLRKTVELEKETVLDTALSVLTTDLFKKQAMTLNHQAKVQAKERDIQYRQARIEQLEVYLSEGQKQVYRYNEGLDGGPTMAEVDREHNRIQAELNAQKAVEDIQAKVSYHQQILQQREAALRMREEQYKALIRARFEAEMVQKAMPDMEAKLDEVAHIEYNHGFGAGRAAGRAEAEEEARQKGFLEGYGACYRSQITISNFRQGLISRDSPELDFLFDPAHADNMFTMGARVSGAECRKEKALLPHMAQRKEVPADKEPSVQHRIEEPAMQRKPEESVRRLALAPRPTFASELRGAQTMHNGHFVLANGSGSSSPASTPKIGSNGGSGGGMTRRMDEENKGRSIIKYEEAEESDLIDLY